MKSVAQTHRWNRRKDERGPEILDAALACFAEKGFAATRMDDIARRAGISKGTIYLYFDSKEALFKALTRQAIGTQLEAVKAQVEAHDGDSADLLRLVIATIGHFAATSDRVVLPRVLLAEVGNFPELAEFWRHEIIDRVLGVLQTIIQRGQARGEFRPMAPLHAAHLCVAPMLVMMLWRTIFGKYDTVPYDYQGLVDAHLETLLRGLAPQGKPA